LDREYAEFKKCHDIILLKQMAFFQQMGRRSIVCAEWAEKNCRKPMVDAEGNIRKMWGCLDDLGGKIATLQEQAEILEKKGVEDESIE